MVQKHEKTCCFAGHREIADRDVENSIKKIAEDLIVTQNVKTFLVGHYGRFDACCHSVIQKLKKVYQDISLDLVIPYLTNEINEYKELYYQNYDRILIADMPLNTPRKFQIIQANFYMIDSSDYLICYINRSFGGAAQTYRYAKRKNLTIFNIAELVKNINTA